MNTPAHPVFGAFHLGHEATMRATANHRLAPRSSHSPSRDVVPPEKLNDRETIAAVALGLSRRRR
jgi:hypothetical protein